MKFKLVQKANPSNRTLPLKWYANPVNGGTKTIADITKIVAGRSSLTSGDVQNVLANFMEELPTLLKDGFSIQLGAFGTMRLTLSSEGVEKVEDFKTSSISTKVIFTPGPGMKKQLEDIKYTKVAE